MSDTLRSNLIRLASVNPSLRPHLLPLLREAGRLPPARWNTPAEDLPFSDAKYESDAFGKEFDKRMRTAFDLWEGDMVRTLGSFERPRDSLAMLKAAGPIIEAGLRDFRRALQSALLSAHRERTF